MINGLNPAQSEAAEHVSGPLIIFAGAGTGKTKTITLRVANLIQRHGVLPARILMVTFTNKAAREMRERLIPLIGKEATKQIWAGTFHSICARILRAHADAVHRKPNFVIYDDGDQETVIKRVLGELGLDKKFWPPGAVAARIQKAKQNAFAPSELPTFDEESAMFAQIWDGYERWMRSCNAFDFEDLIYHTMRLAESATPIGEMLRERFEQVLVDEFQDTNGTQYRLVCAMAKATGNLCVVGDDDQTIYTWRGANVSNIREFERKFTAARVVKLEQNYRSTQNIVACAMGIIEKSSARVKKQLWTASAAGEQVLVVATADDREEASFVVGSISKHLRKGAVPSSIAILYRSHAQSRAIEDELRDHQIPYAIVAGHRFYDRSEVKDVVSYLRTVTSPESNVDVLRIINSPSRGIGDDSLKRLGEIASSEGVGLWDAIPKAIVAANIPRKARAALSSFHDMIVSLGATANTDRPSDVARRVIDGTGYRKMWIEEVAELGRLGRKAELEAAKQRLANVDEVINAVAAYEQRSLDEGEIPTIGGYVQMVGLTAEKDDGDAAKVTMMTVHASKGLEFPHVYLAGFEDGRFPTKSADTDPLLLEEERRLAYVAITRGKTTVTVTCARVRMVRGVNEYASPSRFVHDMPPDNTVRTTAAAMKLAAAERLQDQ